MVCHLVMRQAVWFIVFYNLNKTDERITVLLSLLAIGTCIQRIYTRRHTLEQVIVGSLIGSMLGFMASKNIKNILHLIFILQIVI